LTGRFGQAEVERLHAENADAKAKLAAQTQRLELAIQAG
jgi:hypothetical protein